MRILQLIHSLDPSTGGTAEAVRQLSIEHSRLGHHIELACMDEAGSPWLKDIPLTSHAFGPARGYGYSPRLLPWLKERHKDFDIVVVNGLWQYPGLAAWKTMNATGTPYVVVPHGMLDPWFKRHYPLKHLKKWMYWPWAEYRILRDARLVLFTTQEERLLSRQSFWLYRAREHVVHLGIAPPPSDRAADRRAFLDAFPQLQTHRNLLFLGRIHEKKGVDLLVQAFAALAQRASDLHLVMAGPDPQGLRPALEETARAAGVASRITWTGMLTGSLKWGALHNADAFILPSHQENFGLSVVEALACGVPVLISDKVNIWREIEADRAGLVAGDDMSGTVQLLTRWLACSDADRSAMRDAARTCFARRFLLESAAKGMLAALEAACSPQTQAAS